MNIFRRKSKDGKLASPFHYYRFTFEGTEHSGSTRTTDAKLARQILSKKYTQAVEGRHLDKVKKRNVPTLKAYSETYLNGYALNKRSRRCDELSLDNSILPALGGKRLDQISPGDIEAWRNQRLKAKKKRGKGTMAPASVRLEVACLKTILNLAVRDGLIDASPARNVRMPRVNNRRDRVVTPAEYKRLLGQLRTKGAHINPILVLGYETGMRVGEILGLRWQDLQRRKGFAYLADTKNGTSRWVPLNEAAREAMGAWPRRTDTDLLFAGPTGKPYRSIRTVWTALCSRARVENARFHDLRHTFTTRMLEAGVDIRTIMAVTGHKDVAMFARYSHPSDLHLKAAVEGLAGRTLVSNLGTLVPGHHKSASK
jgi:integrase